MNSMRKNIVVCQMNLKHTSCMIKFRPLGVASARTLIECTQCFSLIAPTLHSFSHILDVNSLSLFSERGPIAAQQETHISNQSERTTPDCQQTYIRVAVRNHSVIIQFTEYTRQTKPLLNRSLNSEEAKKKKNKSFNHSN